jgi:hypothetical protein
VSDSLLIACSVERIRWNRKGYKIVEKGLQRVWFTYLHALWWPLLSRKQADSGIAQKHNKWVRVTYNL